MIVKERLAKPKKSVIKKRATRKSQKLVNKKRVTKGQWNLVQVLTRKKKKASVYKRSWEPKYYGHRNAINTPDFTFTKRGVRDNFPPKKG